MDFLRAELKSVDEDRGTWTAVASAEVIDRDNERVMSRSLTWRTPTIPVHIDHDLSIKSLVGRCRPYYDASGALLVDGKWNTSELAQATRRAVNDGSLDAMSIVFLHAKRAKGPDGITEIQGGELIATDWVTIPSCTASRVLSSRAYNPTPTTVADARRIARQAMLDLARLDLDVARHTLDRIEGTKYAPVPRDLTPIGISMAIADAKALLRDLSRKDPHAR